jgi:hypothetical protein
VLQAAMDPDPEARTGSAAALGAEFRAVHGLLP